MSTYIGIDPGMSGGIAVLSDAAPPIAFKMPETERDVWDLFIGYLMGPDAFALIERVGANRGPDNRRQGASSMFTFGRNYGCLRGCLVASGIPFEEVQPAKWQAAFGLCRTNKDEGITAKKNRHKAKAQTLFPNAVKLTHKVADAILIAEYCRRKRNGTL